MALLAGDSWQSVLDPPPRPSGRGMSPAAVAMAAMAGDVRVPRRLTVVRMLVGRAVHGRVLALRQDLNQDLAVRINNVRVLSARGGRSSSTTGG